MRRLIFTLAGIGIAAGAVYKLVFEPWWHRWGIEPDEAVRALPGDDVIPGAVGGETRAITINASPEAIWPWLVQMGYRRAGWYSYDVIDMSGSSADRIEPDWQDLKAGEIVPTHPGGGFRVESIDPNRSLVLYFDSEMVRTQEAEAKTSAATPANLKVAGAFMENTQPTEFTVTWAFVLDPMSDGRTRLIERTRIAFGETDRPWTRFTLPLMGFGVFVMVRRQLIGIKERVERAAVTVAEPAPVPA